MATDGGRAKPMTTAVLGGAFLVIALAGIERWNARDRERALHDERRAREEQREELAARIRTLEPQLERARAAGLAALADGLRTTDPMAALLVAREAVRAAPHHDEAVAALRRALYASHERAVLRRDGETGPRALAWSPDGTFLLVGQEKGGAVRWDPRAGTERALVALDDAAAPLVAVSGQRVVTGSVDGTVSVWWADGAATVVNSHRAPVSACAFAPNGDAVVTGGRDGSVLVSGAPPLPFPPRLESHAAAVTALGFAGDALVSASADGTARVWAADGTFASLRHEGAVLALAVSRDGAVATGASDGNVRLWDLRGTCLATLPHDADVTAVAWSPDGELLASGADDGTLRLWTKEGEKDLVLRPHDARIASVEWSRDGRRVVTGSWDGTARVLDRRGGTVARFVPRGGWIDQAAFSPDGARVATVARDGTARVFDVAASEVAAFAGHTDAVRALAFAPDGALWSGSEDGSVRCWHLDSGGSRAAIQFDGGGVVRLEVSGEDLRATTREGVVHTIRPRAPVLEGGIEEGPEPVEPAPLVVVRGDFVAKVLPDEEVHVARNVHRDAYEQLAHIAPGPSRVGALAVSEDERFVVTGHLDGVVRVWAVADRDAPDGAHDDLLAAADRRVTRELTGAERKAWADLLPPR